jgi:hypothetical protein
LILSDFDDDKGKRHGKSEAVYDMERPNHFAVRTKSDGKPNSDVDLVCDGKKLYRHAKTLKQFTEDAAADGFPAIGSKLPELRTENTGMWFYNVLVADPYESLMDGVNRASYAGTEKVNGTEAHHLKFEQPDFKWEVWIAAAGKPHLLKALTRKPRLTVVETYQNWKIDGPIAQDAFTFSPGAESKKVDAIKSDE